MVWSLVKYRPKMQVIIIEVFEFFIFIFMSSLCAQVTETPDLTRIIVFNNGTFMGLKELIILGGQFTPISILGEILE